MRNSIRISLFAVTLLACSSDSTRPIDPAVVTSVSLSPATNAVVKGSQMQLTSFVHDSVGNEVNIVADWASSAPAVATVSETGVVSGVGYGVATITTSVGTHSATAEVVVTEAASPRPYSVMDLGVVTGIDQFTRHFSDSGDVLARQAGKVYRNGVVVSMPECVTPVTLNGQGHVLCSTGRDSVSSYSIWRNGSVTPIAAADTFAAEFFRAFALNDSGEVAGVIYHPTFANASCSASASCVSLWKNGAPEFPGLNHSPTEGPWYLNGQQQMVSQDPIFAPNATTPTAASVYDAATHQQRSVPTFVRAMNDAGWVAVESMTLIRGPSRIVYTSEVASPSKTIELGSGSASGINNSNVVVGTLDIGAFIWRGGGVSLLTNAATDAGWTITAADQINDRGQILATADNSDGRTGHTVILTPTQP